MALDTTYWARIGVEPAGNADLNPTVDSAIEITFSNVDPYSGDIGDYQLDQGDLLNPYDPNTWISLDGTTWQQFDVLTYGIVDHNNPSLYDFTGVGGPNFNNFTLVSIQLDDGTRLTFYPTENFSEADMNLLPHGGVPLKDDPDYPVDPPPVCFLKGTFIASSNVSVSVENLRIGDTVETRDNGNQVIVWVGTRKLSRKTSPHHTPIRISANALGDGLPTRDLLVSPQHRVLLTDWRAELLFGETEVLVAAKHLVNDDTIRVATDLDEFEYFHILFNSHQTIFSEGLPTESFHPGDMAMNSLSEASRNEVLELFPELADGVENYGPAAHPALKSFEAKALQRA